jgi:hypothetical protein
MESTYFSSLDFSKFFRKNEIETIYYYLYKNIDWHLSIHSIITKIIKKINFKNIQSTYLKIATTHHLLILKLNLTEKK